MTATHPIPGIRQLDVCQFDTPGTGAAYVIEAPRLTVVETGTARAASVLRQQLHSDRPAYAVVTHVHLDHAGGAGLLADCFPDLHVGVHARGARHLANPERLIQGVRAASPDLFPLYGDPIPIPSAQLLPLSGGEIFDLGAGYVLEAIATPGHAPHHLCYFEHRTSTVFAGDAVGNWQRAVDTPLTVPPGFDLEQGIASLHRLRELRPKHLAFTHFGVSHTPRQALDRYEQELLDWFEDLRRLTRSYSDNKVVELVLARPQYVRLSELERAMVEMCIRGGLLSLVSADT